QSDYFQATKGGGHGDYHLIVLAPNSVQEMADFARLGFDLAFKYRNPVIILSDGAIGQMMEKVRLFDQQPRFTTFDQSWVTTGKTPDREKNVITSLDLDPLKMEQHNKKLQAKFQQMRENEIRFEKIECDDADYLLIAYGTCARICQKTVKLGRQKGIKLGLLRPITLFPFPTDAIEKMTSTIKGILTVEMSSGQMVEDVRLAVNGKTKVAFHGRMGGTTPSPDEVLTVLEQQFLKT
ncbi:MAG: 3-methyl-2-oxobutanoate dehydrogenase subunit beta, partial [Deltaproteobacteria bacterium]|nr:3-methyl-2-oxobutanoate dehydrogenase subunit beta [Deltaproteobacteria bacterium]